VGEEKEGVGGKGEGLIRPSNRWWEKELYSNVSEEETKSTGGEVQEDQRVFNPGSISKEGRER